MKKLLAIGALAVTLTACGSEEQSASSDFWADVPADKAVLIDLYDEYATGGDCSGLQDAFDQWDNSNIDAGVKADLLGYIDGVMNRAGCYD